MFKVKRKIKYLKLHDIIFQRYSFIVLNINEKTLLFIRRFKSVLNSKINTFKIKKNNYIHLFDPNKFIASQKDTEDVIILAGSFELKSHIERFNKISKNKTCFRS